MFSLKPKKSRDGLFALGNVFWVTAGSLPLWRRIISQPVFFMGRFTVKKKSEVLFPCVG